VWTCSWSPIGGLERQGTKSSKQSDQQTAAIAKKDGGRRRYANLGEWTEHDANQRNHQRRLGTKRSAQFGRRMDWELITSHMHFSWANRSRPTGHRTHDKENEANILLGCKNLGDLEFWGPCSIEHFEPVHRRAWVLRSVLDSDIPATVVQISNWSVSPRKIPWNLRAWFINFIYMPTLFLCKVWGEIWGVEGFEPQPFTSYSHPLDSNLFMRSLVRSVIPLRCFPKG
jgi:hypothetical protein